MAVHGFPRALIFRLIDSQRFMKDIYRWARLMRGVRMLSRRKLDWVDSMLSRPSPARQLNENINRDGYSGGEILQPNIDNSPFSKPIGTTRQELPVIQSPAQM
jgi:hypothetical protein